MKKRTFHVSALAGSIIWLVVAKPSLANGESANQPRHTFFSTSEIDIDHPSGANDGTLDVFIYANGNVSGYYRPVDSGRFVEVTGATSDGRIYLDIGKERPIVGTYDGVKIVGFRDFGLDRYRFSAVLVAQPQT